MKLKKDYLWIAFIVVCMAILFTVLTTDKKDNVFVGTQDAIKFKEEYESLNEKVSEDNKKYPQVNISSINNIEYITIDKAINILESGTAAMYIGYSECVYCRSAVQVLVDTAKDMDLDAIYYLDISDIWDIKEVNDQDEIITTVEANEKYDELLAEIGDEYLENYILLNKNNEEIDTQQKRLKVPLVIFIVNGEIVSSKVGTLFSQFDPYEPLNEDQKIGLSEIYSYGIKDVLKGLADN